VLSTNTDKDKKGDDSMKISFFNDADEAIAFASSASFYAAIAVGLMGLAIAIVAIGIYGDKANKIGFGKLLRKIAVFFLDGSMLFMILPFLYIVEATITFRSLIENFYIVLTKVFTM
jgi:hypothetical protein